MLRSEPPLRRSERSGFLVATVALLITAALAVGVVGGAAGMVYWTYRLVRLLWAR